MNYDLIARCRNSVYFTRKSIFRKNVKNKNIITEVRQLFIRLDPGDRNAG